MYGEHLGQEWRRERDREQHGAAAASPTDGYGLSEDERRIPGAVAAAKAMQAARDPASGDLESFRHMGIQTRRLHAVS